MLSSIHLYPDTAYQPFSSRIKRKMSTQKGKPIKIFGNFNLKPPFKRIYPIYWVIFPEEPKSAYGICGYMGRAFTVASSANWAKITAITDLIISDGNCEEAKRCLVIGCQHNQTTPKSFASAHNLSIKKLQRTWTRLISNVNSVVIPPKLIHQNYQSRSEGIRD